MPDTGIRRAVYVGCPPLYFLLDHRDQGLDATPSPAASLSEEEFCRRFRGSPVRRAKRRGFLRNVAVALGNSGSPEAVPALALALLDDEPLVRGHAAWALGRIGGGHAARALRERLDVEGDPEVKDELEQAIAECGGRDQGHGLTYLVPPGR